MTGYPTPEMRARMAAAPGTPPTGPAGASSANTEPRCAHCGEPLTTGAVIREWTGLTGGPGRRWHGERDACKAAAFGTDDELGPVSPTDADVLRDARRDALLVLLSRAGRGVLSVDEGELLRHHVEAEIRAGDQARELAAHDRSPDGQPSTVVVHLNNRNAVYEPWPASDALSDTSPTPDGGLREQYAAAIEHELSQFFREHPEEPRNSPWALGMKDAAACVRAATTARDRHMEQIRRERDLAIAHDRQPYPTAWAYEQACKAREKHRERAETAEAAVREMAQAIRLTREYVGAELLPAVEGWSWYDALRNWAPEYLAAMLGSSADTAPPADTCRPVEVDGDTIRVHGAREMTEQEVGYLGEVVAAAKRKLAAEPPVVPDDDGTESELTRRIRAQQRGETPVEPEPHTGLVVLIPGQHMSEHIAAHVADTPKEQ